METVQAQGRRAGGGGAHPDLRWGTLEEGEEPDEWERDGLEQKGPERAGRTAQAELPAEYPDPDGRGEGPPREKAAPRPTA
eukprot:1871328-Lingulodinium_polyedra.AAC.1